jgi:phosphoribosylanthranilate isomerase
VIDPSERPLCVKVCGITRAADAVAAIEAGADLLGFNFYPKSPRYIDARGGGADRGLLAAPGARGRHLRRRRRAPIRHAIATAQLGLVQLHGDETPDFCRASRAGDESAPVASLADLERAPAPYPDGWLLADTADPTRYGGTGRRCRSSRCAAISRAASSSPAARARYRHRRRARSVRSASTSARAWSARPASRTTRSSGRSSTHAKTA